MIAVIILYISILIPTIILNSLYSDIRKNNTTVDKVVFIFGLLVSPIVFVFCVGALTEVIRIIKQVHSLLIHLPLEVLMMVILLCAPIITFVLYRLCHKSITVDFKNKILLIASTLDIEEN